jgi:hypothetical protein
VPQVVRQCGFIIDEETVQVQKVGVVSRAMNRDDHDD